MYLCHYTIAMLSIYNRRGRNASGQFHSKVQQLPATASEKHTRQVVEHAMSNQQANIAACCSIQQKQ